MAELVYPRERTLGAITLILGILAWLILIFGTVGVALIGLAIGFLIYLFAHSALIAHLRGNGIELTPEQFPDLHAQFAACCDRLEMKNRPQAYVLNGNGILNAFATKFLGTQFVVLMSDVVDAMERHVDGVRFYIGHELGHLRMKHLQGQLLRWPVLWLPLLGAAYSRARETTCDRHGLACCQSPEGAARALAALSAGPVQWQKLNIAEYLKQVAHSKGFWMSFHELTAGYPWLTKRVARVMNRQVSTPSRNFFSYILAVFVPYAGRLGAGFSAAILIYIAVIIAAVALPAYQDYTVRAKANAAVVETQSMRTALANYYLSNKQVPPSLQAAGIPSQLADGTPLRLDLEDMALIVVLKKGELIFKPSLDDDEGHIHWVCSDGEGLKPNQVPVSCRAPTGSNSGVSSDD